MFLKAFLVALRALRSACVRPERARQYQLFWLHVHSAKNEGQVHRGTFRIDLLPTLGIAAYLNCGYLSPSCCRIMK